MKAIKVLLFLFIASSCTTKQPTVETKVQKPKNIILMIGDGMGLSQVSSAFYFQNDSTNFWRFPVVGLLRTSSASHKITDSAAGATAYANGHKTYNGAIGVDTDTIPLTNISEILSPKGMNIGLVVTSSIVHATPAPFYAHVKHRYQYEDIASQLPGSGIRFFAGGGLKFFNERSDGLNYLDSLTSFGFQIDTTGISLDTKFDPNSKYGYLLAPDGMPIAAERGAYLPKATKAALNYLDKDPNGFFLMIEGSQIDWGGHENNADYLIGEELDFDKTIGVVLDYAKEHPETLVIVTADHETGGFTLAADHANKMSGDYNTIAPSFSTTGHSTTLVPVFAKGPGEEAFGGISENNTIFGKILKALGATPTKD